MQKIVLFDVLVDLSIYSFFSEIDRLVNINESEE